MILLFLLMELGILLLCGWFFMLGVGVVHHDWLPGLPTVGYFTAVVVAFLFRLAFGNYLPDDWWRK